jgi:hypothetical protein
MMTWAARKQRLDLDNLIEKFRREANMARPNHSPATLLYAANELEKILRGD